MAQFGRPISDVTTTNWATTPLWSKIDEVSADDGDSISAVASSAATAECALTSSLSDPSSSVGHTVRFRALATKTNKAALLTVGLYQGTTLIASTVLDAEVDMTTSFAPYSFPLTGGEADTRRNA